MLKKSVVTCGGSVTELLYNLHQAPIKSWKKNVSSGLVKVLFSVYVINFQECYKYM